jgi:type II secretion system protein N
VSRSPRIDPGTRSPAQSRKLLYVAYTVLGLTLFGAYLVATFPYSPTLSKVLAPMGLEFTSTSQSASFPFGAKLSGVRLKAIKSTPGGLMVESPAVTIAPSFLSMLLFHPGVRVKAALYDGIVNVTLRSSDGGTAISYDLDSVDISRQTLFPLPEADASGTLSGNGSIWLDDGNVAQTGNGELSAAHLIVKSPFMGIPIDLGDGQSKFKLDQGTLTIEHCATSGGEVALNASGTVQLAPDPSQSVLAIEFTLSPTADAASRLARFFMVLPHPPGPEPYHLTGTLSAPRIM